MKKIKQTMDAAQQKPNVKRWKNENKLFLNNVLGLPELAHHKRFLSYCPAWMAGKKKGRPKINVRVKSVMDHVAESAKKKRKRKVRMWCEICHRFTHNTDDCLKNTKGQGGNNDNDDWFDGLEEEKPNVGGEEGRV